MTFHIILYPPISLFVTLHTVLVLPKNYILFGGTEKIYGAFDNVCVTDFNDVPRYRKLFSILHTFIGVTGTTTTL